MLTSVRLSIIYLLISNVLLLYGVLALHWPIFPIVYLWWWEGLLGVMSDYFLWLRIDRTKASLQALFPYAIYIIFIVIFLGVIGARENNVLTNLSTLMFQDPLFNLSLLLLMIYTGHKFIRWERPSDLNVGSMQIRIHVGIVLGGLAIFIAHKMDWENTTAMAIAILLVKIAMDIVSINAPLPKR